MDVEFPTCGTKGVWSSTDAGGEPGSGQHAPGSLGLEESIPRAPFTGAEPDQSCSFAVGLLPPEKSMFVLACSERAWAGSLPRGLALARHSCRLDTMILTQIPHT